ncbi:DUF4157 domain-containing protein [Desmonostoc muscorum LEGE 12446]|uniref:DUF4157 domain-containing protein n=1 Tax=Desmonostoc muscorum LEGE 12446 TaxID=1828758 RepID=A0A8J7CXK3_DESMC|nr:DUF4157 domain-containing protein [Desmonostoc muscorum]MCF2145863.1 DUF4157 domain-containing protein [Desmonostoc muscorum LEGE 12446]
MSNSYTFGHKKAGTSTFSYSSLISPTTPTLANPTRGFGLPTNNTPIQQLTSESTNQEEAQSANEQSLEPQAIKQPSFSHDISRIALRRPQAKLTVGEPGDKYEQEADWVANQVMQMVVPQKLNAPTVNSVQDSLQPKCAACEQEEEKVQTKPSLEPATDRGLQAGDNIESQINTSKGGGSLLSDEVRGFMEPRFGADFSSVRVHTDSEAMQMNQELGAQAFTHGSDIYFGGGKSALNNELMAHELTHVVQQTGAVQTKQVWKQPTVQRKCSVCEKEELEVQRSPNISALSQSGIQRWSPFDDDEDQTDSESSSSGGILDWAKDKASGAVDTVTQAGSDAYDWAEEKAGGAVDTVTQAGSDAYDWAEEKASGAVDTVTQAGGDAYDWAKEKGGAAVDSVTQAGSDAYDWAKEKGGAAVDSVTQAGSDAYDWAKQQGSEAVEAVTDLGGEATDWIANSYGIQVDWNSEPGRLVRAWTYGLDPELVQNLRSKNPTDLHNLIDIPEQVQQAANVLAAQASMNVAPAPVPVTPTPNPIPPFLIPEPVPVPPGPAPIPPAPVTPVSPGPSPVPRIGPGVLLGPIAVGIIVFIAIMLIPSNIFQKGKTEDEYLEENRKREEEKKRKQKQHLGDCTETQHRELQDEVNKQCKQLERSCDDETLNCAELRSRWQRNERCAKARENINQECYQGGDNGHREATESAHIAEDKCREQYRKKKC